MWVFYVHAPLKLHINDQKSGNESKSFWNEAA